MSIRIQESLNRIREARKQAIQEQADYQAGKRKEAPSVDPKSFDVAERMILNINGDYEHGRTSVQESLTTTDVVKLIPKVIEGQLREAAEPEYLATKFMNIVHVDGGNSVTYVIPVVGELVAGEVSEAGRYPEDQTDFNTVENGQLEIKVKKIGLKVRISEEAISDSSWDIYGINVRKMGQAMGRYKERWCFNSFSNHGHVVFDNNLRTQMPEAGTHGRAEDGSMNDTMTVEDFIDMVLALMSQDQTPTDIIMHPLCWTIFARNAMIGNGMTYGALGGQFVHPWGATQTTPGFAGLSADMGPQKFVLTPQDTQGRLPMPLNVEFSPMVNFDKVNKKYDMYCVNRSNVGVIAERDALSTDNWTDPERDMRLLKVKERYGVGIMDNGRGIVVARNLAIAPTYPVPPTVRIDTNLVTNGD